MIDRVVGNKLLPAEIRQDIIEPTDGIPLFVEEMTKAVLEADSEGAARRTVAAVPSPTLAVPATLHASLMARLDRLGPAKEVAQIGAVMDASFSLPCWLRWYASPKRTFNLRLIVSLRQVCFGESSAARKLFKHALVQDAAYGRCYASRVVSSTPVSPGLKPIRRLREPPRAAGSSLH
jgi:predicted ATPase